MVSDNALHISRALWTISILTIPGREQYLQRLIESINTLMLHEQAVITVVYNKKVQPANEHSIESSIKNLSTVLPIEVYFNQSDTSIVGGRMFQINLCKTPLIVFIDDDLTLHGNIFPALHACFQTHPLGIIGIPSYVGDSNVIFKPRASTPHVDIGDVRYMHVQGMVIATYRTLLADIGGFNSRRRYWGEWTELNLRMWRHGFPTGYIMDKGHLRHWEQAPDSPTRSLSGREKNVLWGLMCTALEYDAANENEATQVFWQLVEERYLAYSFGDQLNLQRLLRTVLSLMPEISAEWSNIVAFRQQTQQHRYQFMPFHNFSQQEVQMVLETATRGILPYRNSVSW
jgi:hypothetical protein